MRVSSGQHKSYGSKMINRLGSNPNQLAGFNRKTDSKKRSHFVCMYLNTTKTIEALGHRSDELGQAYFSMPEERQLERNY
jgi:hypothetical protein